MSSSEAEALKRILERERRARKTAEKLLEAKSQDLYKTNERLTQLASALEVRVNERTAELATQNSLLSALLESIKAGILFESPKQEGILVNQYLCTLLELDFDATNASKLSAMQFTTAIGNKFVDPHIFLNQTTNCLESKQSVVNEEWELKNGRFISRDYLPLHIENEYQGHFWLYSDISYSKELERSQAAAEAGTQAKSIFLANMSHEIRTPLNGIIGMNRLLIEHGLQAKQLQYAQSVQESASSLLQVINDILDFSKVEAGRIDLEIIDFSLQKVIDSVFELLQIRATNKDLDFNIICDSSLPQKLSGDPSRLRQILINLVGNAIKFTSSGSVTFMVSCVNLSDKIAKIEFEIRDTGIGISKSDIEKQFTPFSQADASVSRRFGGTGLGLAITKDLLEEMGGELSVRATVNEGSTFTAKVDFPIVDNSPQEKGIFNSSDFTCLITASKDSQRESLRYMMKLEGVSPTLSENLNDAQKVIEKVDQNTPTVWIISSDGMNASEQSKLLKVIEFAKDNIIPILLSRNVQEGTKIDLSSFSPLHLPLSRKTLYRRICSLLGIGIDSDTQQASAAKALKSLNLKPIRILLAEDNIINQQMASITLTKLGAQVDIAANGLEALRMLDQISYDVILMDINMPELDGIETCMRIRQMGMDIPIVALTANAMKGDKERFLEAGMDHYLSKPLDPKALIEVLMSLFSDKTPTAEKVFDQTALLETLGGNVEIAKEVISVFLKQQTTTRETLATAKENDDWTNARSPVHRLCGSSYSIFALEVGKEASALENLLRETPQSTEAIKEALSRLTEAQDRFEQTLSQVTWKDTNED